MRILISDYPDSMASDHDREARLLREGLGELDVVVHPYAVDRHSAFLDELARSDALLTGFLPLPAETLAAASALRCVSINATGFDRVDLAAARQRGIAVCVIDEYCTEDVASHTMTLALALHHQLKHFTAQIEVAHRWFYGSAGPTPRFVEETLGIVGLGRIGSRVAAKARAWGLTVLACDPFVGAAKADALGVRLVSKEELFAASDIVSNHMNATPENQGYFNEDAFAAMVRRPVFLNTARSSAVVEADLVDAVDRGIVRAAGLDVLANEQPDLAQHPLVGRENVIITPHAAFYSAASEEALIEISVANLVHCMRGEDELVRRYV